MFEKLVPYFLLLILLTIAAEALYSFKNKKELYEKKDTFFNIGTGVLGVITRFFLKGVSLFVWYYLYTLSPFKIETTVWSLIILFFLNELVYYWFHRLSHKIPILWATHVNHHSSLKMNFSVAARTPFMNAIYHSLFWIPLPLIGFEPLDILMVETFTFLFNFTQHTTLIPKLGVLEYVFNTPSHHRVHHASNPQYIDKNFGNSLIIFDKLFGTFEEEIEKPIYGLSKNPSDRSFINMIFHEWKNILGIGKTES